MMKSFCFIVSLIFVYLFQAFAQSPCNPKLEAKAEAIIKECNLRKMKAKKLWESLETAKKDIETAISKKDIYSLAPYIGCDASDSSYTEVICEPDLPRLSINALSKIIDRSKNQLTIKNSHWINYGIKKDIFLLCSSDYGFKAAKNDCDDSGKAQPIIEIRNTPMGFYIFGIPFTGE